MRIWPISFTHKPPSAQATAIRNRGWLFVVPTALIIVAMVSLCVGASGVSIGQSVRALFGGDTQSVAYRVLMYIRLPRLLGALSAGAALAVSGTLIQAVLHNPLAGPNVIGVNAGAGFFALLGILLFPGVQAAVPTLSFIGALFACLLIYAIAQRTGASRLTLVLAGIAISGILGAGIDTITTLDADVLLQYQSFRVGGFSGLSLTMLQPAIWYIVVGLILALCCAADMNVLMLGEQTAASLGLHVARVRFVLLATAAVLAGSAVSFAGLLGFVGLIVPHICRHIWGGDHRILLPASMGVGALFVLTCDLLSRILFMPYEIPVGILMSLMGGPFFLWLIFRYRRRRSSHD